ncbi:MAG: sulfite exporter TauE/SafE family protein [Acidobacteria bacterium]|nr:sulfite exporter TauE/SafE family protein [Acidobacteriota bacterium]
MSHDVTLLTIGMVMGLGALGGMFGAMLGLGGGVFLVPLLTLGFGLPFRQAAGIGLMTVIATSSVVSAQRAGDGTINLRLGIVLEIATTLGGLAGGLTALWLSQRTLRIMFGLVALGIAGVMFSQMNKRNALPEGDTDTGWLGGQFYSTERGRMAPYRVRRLPLALGMSFIAGNVSGLLGIGGGILKVPVLTSWCGVPLRVAATTSSLMIGVTAAASAPIYYAAGEILPQYAAASVLGVMIGTRAGFWVADRTKVAGLKIMLGCVLIFAALMMLVRA